MLTVTGLLNDLVAADERETGKSLTSNSNTFSLFLCQVALMIYDVDLGTLRNWESFSMNSQKCKNICKRENVVKTNATYF